MRVMGLDVGDRRIGVALSDSLGLTAQPLTVLERRGAAADAAAVRARREARGAGTVGGRCESLAGAAQPRRGLGRRGGGAEAAAVRALVEAHGVDTVVVGLPLT